MTPEPFHHANGSKLGPRPDYSDCVVLKPWGFEFQVFDNGACCIWLLHIRANQGTSIHCHINKQATFVPLLGQLTCRTNFGRSDLSFPASMSVDKCEFHSVGNETADGIFLLEIERPSNKDDLFRLRDSYGRSQGYEGGDNIVRSDIDLFGHFTFSEDGEAEFLNFKMRIRDGALFVTGGWNNAMVSVPFNEGVA